MQTKQDWLEGRCSPFRRRLRSRQFSPFAIRSLRTLMSPPLSSGRALGIVLTGVPPSSKFCFFVGLPTGSLPALPPLRRGGADLFISSVVCCLIFFFLFPSLCCFRATPFRHFLFRPPTPTPRASFKERKDAFYSLSFELSWTKSDLFYTDFNSLFILASMGSSTPADRNGRRRPESVSINPYKPPESPPAAGL